MVQLSTMPSTSKAKRAEYQRAYRARHPERVNARRRLKWQEDETHRQLRRKYQLEFYSNPENRMHVLATNARNRCRKNGMAFDPRIVPYLKANVPAHCPCCMVALDFTLQGSRTTKPNAPSIDRMDSNLGYVLGNVQIICWRCNWLKSDATLEELERIVAFMRARA